MTATGRIDRKAAAIEFLHQVSAGRVEEAFARHVAPGLRHHNAHFRGDAETLARAMSENARQFPNKTLDVHRALEDGELVALHSLVHLEPGDRGVALVHIFRFEAGRIAELWDVAMPIPEISPNENGIF
jgi:predicted SnoaL-like aldol condensation-catalyzing enzyme